MRLTKLNIKNFRSFDPLGQSIVFTTPHNALVGKNNAGKSNIFLALSFLFGSKSPAYIPLEEDDYFDISRPIEIEAVISEISNADKSYLFSLPNLTKQQKGALASKASDGSASITLLLRRNLSNTVSSDESEETQDTFDVSLWGFNVYKRKEDVRRQLTKMILVPAVRDYQNQLSASRWTSYGELMKDVLENSPNYASIKTGLSELNTKIQQVFAQEKNKLLEGAKTVSYVDDINFQLTKDNSPSELLRNLEIFITEGSKVFNIDHVGTGTQSAIIVGILELALKRVGEKLKLFCIEEPEIFIHPHGVRYLSTLINNIPNDANSQVIISTHSLSLVANFEPIDIIRVDKVDGKTVIVQDSSLSNTHLKRFVHQDNAEMFFSDRLILVEGSTEKHLLSRLDKITKINLSDPNSDNCNFDRINLGVIKLDSVDCIVNYIKIAKAFNIPYSALVDKDFIDDPSKQNICKTLCNEIGVTYQASNTNQLIDDLKSKNILVNTKGEVEDLFSLAEVSAISGKTVPEIQAIFSQHTKRSNAFKKIFNCGKPEYSILISDYYVNNPQLHNPLENLIRNIYLDSISSITF